MEEKSKVYGSPYISDQDFWPMSMFIKSFLGEPNDSLSPLDNKWGTRGSEMLAKYTIVAER